MSRYCGPEPQLLPFPPELVVRILSFLDRACDKKRARLVCKSFAAAGLSSLTSTVSFDLSLIEINYSSEIPHCSSPALDIAMHPVVSKYITTLVCECTQLPSSHLRSRTFQDWWANLCKNQQPWRPEDKYRTYAVRHALQDDIIGKGGDRKIFCTALQQFSNLKCIEFRDVAADEATRDLPRPKWPSALPEEDLYVCFYNQLSLIC